MKIIFVNKASNMQKNCLINQLRKKDICFSKAENPIKNSKLIENIAMKMYQLVVSQAVFTGDWQILSWDSICRSLFATTLFAMSVCKGIKNSVANFAYKLMKHEHVSYFFDVRKNYVRVVSVQWVSLQIYLVSDWVLY